VSAIRLFTDEDVYASLASKLRSKGLDALSTLEANRLGESDESQLEWAAGGGRVLLTFNVADFIRLNDRFIHASRHHAGIIVSRQRAIGDLLRRIVVLTSALSAEEMADRLEFLSRW